ncbi:hypothetical protein PRJ39_06675 [Lysobacter enzymogenes]|uniref:hypothetical protein n=1 Tax=Lysobacter enzymogenes TaxID=69 RepID=UPI003747A4D2
MKFASILLLLFVFAPRAAFARDIKLWAEKQFDQCMRETKKPRKQCGFGGCANIVGASRSLTRTIRCGRYAYVHRHSDSVVTIVTI